MRLTSECSGPSRHGCHARRRRREPADWRAGYRRRSLQTCAGRPRNRPGSSSIPATGWRSSAVCALTGSELLISSHVTWGSHGAWLLLTLAFFRRQDQKDDHLVNWAAPVPHLKSISASRAAPPFVGSYWFVGFGGRKTRLGSGSPLPLKRIDRRGQRREWATHRLCQRKRRTGGGWSRSRHSL